MRSDGAAALPPRRRTRILASLAALLIVIALFLGWIVFGPVDEGLLDRGRHASVVVTDRNGVVLFETLPAAGTRGQWLGAGELPKAVANATIAAEDHRFYSHHGVDPVAVARATWKNVRSLRVVEGGSTITQQVVKLLLDEREGRASRSLVRKAREAMLAVRLERRFRKDEILATYLNLAPYGNRIRGVARASRTYFGVDVSELTTAQAAFLAALPQRPGAFNPLRDPKRAGNRQKQILHRMREESLITGAQEAEALAERLRFSGRTEAISAQHFVERVLETSPEASSGASARIVTTLDATLQQTVSGIIAAHRANLLQHGARAVAVAVLDNASGEWLAWEGSGDYFGSGFGGAIDGVRALRQPGSTLKPFTYASAFEKGSSPATVLPDIPSHFPTAEDGIAYTPRNYDGGFRGPMTVRSALAGSQNIPAVAMLSRVGAPTLLRMLRQAGFDSLDRTADFYGLGLTLGDAEVTLEQLVTAYATFARHGVRIQPVMRRGKAVALRERRIMSERTAFWITDILSDRRAREYAFGEGGNLDFPFTVAAKTGTSSAYRDNWTVGFTREVTVGVWVGNFDREELRNSSGVTGAAPIFNAVMQAATVRARGVLPIGDERPLIDPPDSVERVQVCALSGLLPSTYCPARIQEWLPREAPAQFCSWHRRGGTDWPAEYRNWARTSGLLNDEPVQVADADAAGKRERDLRVRVTHPAEGATFLIDPTLRRQFQAVRFRGVGVGRLTWTVDGRTIGSATSAHPVEWSLVPGRHEVRVTDDRGESDRVTFVVR